MTAKQQEKRDKIRNLAKTFASMTEDQRVAISNKYSIRTVEGRSLSPRNQFLIAMQLPQSSLVGGYNQWKKAGRVVQKGQHGAAILVPSVKDSDKTDRELFFFTATVFDVSQTEEIATNK